LDLGDSNACGRVREEDVWGLLGRPFIETAGIGLSTRGDPESMKGGGHMFKVVREYAKFALSTLSSVMYHTT
jgi:hypothetical protein